ncbi:hypothetical protein [Phenylobacterium sp.]|uniref:hypothetical protein n=1 Tax=Phenylobacterium sp. TaxID=1871053 RepID=UPI00121EE6AF|nr:hypothetical protein [Phenylobacterium sp.]THD63633.1 MAG: hypothetical protein E8A49_04550 [Phenylobacterium sp.]
MWADKLRVDTIRWMAARQAPRKYCERLQVEAELEEIRAEAAARGEGGGKGFTVIVKRFTDVTPEEVVAAEAYERL